jgi:hypothetical protein
MVLSFTCLYRPIVGYRTTVAEIVKFNVYRRNGSIKLSNIEWIRSLAKTKSFITLTYYSTDGESFMCSVNIILICSFVNIEWTSVNFGSQTISFVAIC